MPKCEYAAPRSIGTFCAGIVDLKLAVSISIFPGQLWLEKKHNDSTLIIFYDFSMQNKLLTTGVTGSR